MQTKRTLQEKLGNMIILYYLSASYAAWKVSEFRDILVRIFPHLDWISLRIQSECGKMWTRITPNTDTFYAVLHSVGTYYDKSYFMQSYPCIKSYET